MASRKTVSAIIPVYNGERFVVDAIRSVLEQSIEAAECIVVDDGSVDSTPSLVRSFGTAVRYERQDNAGVSRARNRGVELATGELVAFLDYDDVWLPQKLESQLDEWNRSQADLVLCGMEVVDAGGRVIGRHRLHSAGDLLTGLLTFDGTESVSCGSTGLIVRERFESLGGFDPTLGTSADLDLLIRVLLTGAVGYVDQDLVRYRMHGTNMSRSIGATERDMVRLLAKVFEDPRLPPDVRSHRRRAYGSTYRMLSGSYWHGGNRRAALRMLVSSLAADPTLALDEVRRRARRRAGAGGK